MNKVTIIAILILTTFGCTTSKVNTMLNQLQNLPTPDYSQIKEPQLTEPKAQIENTLMELYNADTTVITSTGIFKYEADTAVLTNQWFKATFLNSQKITDPSNESLSDNLALEIGTYLKPRIQNLKDYEKLEIIFINEANNGSIKQRIHLSIPNLEFIN